MNPRHPVTAPTTHAVYMHDVSPITSLPYCTKQVKNNPKVSHKSITKNQPSKQKNRSIQETFQINFFKPKEETYSIRNDQRLPDFSTKIKKEKNPIIEKTDSIKETDENKDIQNLVISKEKRKQVGFVSKSSGIFASYLLKKHKLNQVQVKNLLKLRKYWIGESIEQPRIFKKQRIASLDGTGQKFIEEEQMYFKGN